MKRFVLAAVFGLVGCGDDEKEVTALSTSEYAQQEKEVTCEAAFGRCLADTRLEGFRAQYKPQGITDKATCMEKYVSRTIVADACTGGKTFDGTKALECVKGYEAATCDTLATGGRTPVPVCGEVCK